jgi:multimeric flavodoxin WrbA
VRILALVGSPRKGGNTDLLVDEILRGSESRDNSSEKIYLYDYEIEPCLDCRKCKRRLLECSLRDEMSQLYPKLENADVIVFGTPVYWYGPTGKMKLLIDRLRPYIANRRLEGKKAVIVIPSEEGSGCCGPITEMFRMSFDYLGITLEGCILARAYEKGEVKKNIEEMENAYQLGRSF